MAYVLGYTKPGIGIYDNRSYPGHIAWVADIEHALHLAVSEDGKSFRPLRNNTGILYPKATFNEGPWPGTTKTLLWPWLFRTEDGTFGVAAIRRNTNAPDPLTTGSVMIFLSKDLVFYEEHAFLKVSDCEITAPKVQYLKDEGVYYVEWTEDGKLYAGTTESFGKLSKRHEIEASVFPETPPAEDPDWACGNILEITAEEERKLLIHFDVIENNGMQPLELTVNAGEAPGFGELPRAVMTYTDGSTHAKVVEYDKAAFEAIDFSVPGTYEIPGTVFQRHFDFPIPLSEIPEELMPEMFRRRRKSDDPEEEKMRKRFAGGISDPCITEHNGKYYLTSSGPFIMRAADKLEDVWQGKVIPYGKGGGCAAELHFIKGVPYIFTSLSSREGWWVVDGAILRCHGDIENPEDWEEPRMVVWPDGRKLCPGGLSIDISYFEDAGVHYAIWSDRRIHLIDGQFVERVSPEPADIYIATIDPDAPWQLTSVPQCVIRPMYGWDRCETEVDEGPYILRHGDDIFIAISGSSTGMADLYTLGFLRAKTGTNLLNPDNWEWIPYPVLTKESVPGQFGPGHNNFVKDPVTGDDLISFHAVPHDEEGLSLGRKPAMRRVHWGLSGIPYVEMTEERDLKPEYKNVVLKLTVK